MIIDEGRNYILTNYQNVRRGGEAVDSDHFTQVLDLDLDFVSEKPSRVEIYNFKDEEGQQKFHKLTSDTSDFSKCFTDQVPLMSQVENWRKTLEKYCKQSFKKIRIRKKNVKLPKENISNLIDQRNMMVKRLDLDEPENKAKLYEINKKIAEEEASENRNKIIKNFKILSDNPENINLAQMWKLCKKIWPKSGLTLPTAKRNIKGKISSSPREIRTISREYKDRLRSRPYRPDLENMKERKKMIFDMKMQLAQAKSSPKWTMEDLDRALGNLKNNKSRDFEGYLNEIFKNGVIGTDLKQSLLLMFNKLKSEKMISKFMNFASVTTVPKKGSRIEPANERGIF